MADILEFNHFERALEAVHKGLALAIRDATHGVKEDYAGYVAIRTGFTKSAAYEVTSDNSTYNTALNRAQGIDEFRDVLPEIEHPTSDLEGYVADAAASAIYLEEGTSRMAAQPAMRPAAEHWRDKLPETAAKRINEALKEALK